MPFAVSLEASPEKPAQAAGFARPRGVFPAVLLGATALAWCIYALQRGHDPERAVLTTGLLFATILVAVPAAYLLRTGARANPATSGLLLLTTCSVLLLAAYLYSVGWYAFFPADFLTWSESDFVNDILKFSIGYPLYTAQGNNESFIYAPGSQLLTYLLAWLSGNGISIAAFRVIQLVYTAAAAWIATLCCRQILRLAFPNLRAADSWLWNSFWFAALLLVATNPLTNPFVHNLHGDALAQLATMLAFYILLKYPGSRSRAALAAMAVFVPAGFLIKQSLLVWAAWYAGFLAICDRSWKRAVAFSAAAGLLLGLALGLCYRLWGAPFFYWTFTVLGHHPVSPLRGFQHLLTAWPYFAAGLLGGVAILQGRNARVLLSAWLIWLGIIGTETYTSGIAWMMNHIGPGSLMAGVWLLSGLASIWDSATALRKNPAERWLRTAVFACGIALFFAGMGLVRIPVRAIPDDAYRYVHDIERTFQGVPADRVLLDAGTWIYAKNRVIMRDRGPCIGDRGVSGIADYSGILSRIAAKQYSKILVRGLHAPDFIYDYFLWPKSSGIRQALLDNYRETGKIRAAEAYSYARNWAEDPYYFGEITILEPKPSSSLPSSQGL
jgi:hypothetical protein